MKKVVVFSVPNLFCTFWIDGVCAKKIKTLDSKCEESTCPRLNQRVGSVN